MYLVAYISNSVTVPDPNSYDSRVVKRIPDYHIWIEELTSFALSVAKGNDWLDAGCGTGNASLTVIKHNPEAKITLFDVSQDMLSIAVEKMKGNCISIQGNITSLPFENQSFDVIMCLFCLHYLSVEERTSTLKKMRNMLKPDGVIVYSEHTAFMDKVTNASYDNRMRSYMMDCGLTSKEVETQMDRCGKEYFPLSIENHFSVLKNAGFDRFDVIRLSGGQVGLAAFR